MLFVPRAPQVFSLHSSALRSTGTPPFSSKALLTKLALRSTGYNSEPANARAFGVFTSQYSKQRFYAKGEQSRMQNAIACAARAVAANQDDRNANFIADVAQRSFAPVQSFPWNQLASKVMLHFTEAVWLVGTWLAVPALILVATRDVLVTIRMGQELLVPLGLLMGTVLTGIVKETFSSVGIEFQDAVLPWHLVVLGLVFVLLRVYAAVVFQAFMALGGLWQTMRYAVDWKARREEPVRAGG